eukprot:6190871-Pleurochrysis_carterae.AAC.2
MHAQRPAHFGAYTDAARMATRSQIGRTVEASYPQSGYVSPDCVCAHALRLAAPVWRQLRRSIPHSLARSSGRKPNNSNFLLLCCARMTRSAILMITLHHHSTISATAYDSQDAVERARLPTTAAQKSKRPMGPHHPPVLCTRARAEVPITSLEL